MILATGRLKQEISCWPGISIHPHQFAAREYRYGKAEVGHVHLWVDVDIPFPRSLHDYLLDQRLADQHRWVPDSGWTTFRIRGDKDIEHAIWLMRLSYIRYVVKSEADPRRFLEAEAERYRFGPDLFTILSRFIPGTAAVKKAVSIPA